MSKDRDQRAGQHPITYDIPLPGNYPCITLQCNVTRYASGEVGRMVLVVREPSEGIELHRAFVERGPWLAVVDALARDITDALRMMEYLQMGDRKD